MLVRRYWLSDQIPHVEEVTLIAGGTTDLAIPVDVEIEGQPLTGPARVAVILGPAAGPAAAADPQQVWELPLPDGVTITDRAGWEAATEALRAPGAAAVAEWEQQQLDQGLARSQALEKVSALAGLTDKERAALFGGAS